MSAEVALAHPRRVPVGLIGLTIALTLLAHILVMVLVFLVVTLLGLDDDAPTLPERVTQTQAVDAGAFEVRTGVRIVRVAAVGDGGLVDLVYEVVDATNAHAIHDPDGPPSVYDDERGVVLSSPFHEHSRSHAPELGDVSHEVLVNHDGVVERGDRVDVLVGDWRLEGVAVQ